MSNSLIFDALALQKMASGHVCLDLSEQINWDVFPEFVEKVLKKFKGKIEKTIDTPCIRLWQVNITGCILNFVFDDFPVMVSLESSSDEGDELLEKIYNELSEKTHLIV